MCRCEAAKGGASQASTVTVCTSSSAATIERVRSWRCISARSSSGADPATRSAERIERLLQELGHVVRQDDVLGLG